MRKIIMNLAMSVDGYIARSDGCVDFLDNLDTGESDLGFSSFLESIDTIVMGKTSYDVTLELNHHKWPFTTKKTYVFSRLIHKDNSHISFINTDMHRFLTELLQQDGNDIWLFGGSNIIKQILKMNLVDELIITVIPKLIGRGIRLFEEADYEQNLSLQSINQVRDIVSYHYTVKK